MTGSHEDSEDCPESDEPDYDFELLADPYEDDWEYEQDMMLAQQELDDFEGDEFERPDYENDF